MRVVWVPQWAVLPVIVEDRAMIEENARREHANNSGQLPDSSIRTRPSGPETRGTVGLMATNSALYDQNSHRPMAQQPMTPGRSTNLPDILPGQLSGRGQSPGNFNMGNMTAALPEYQNAASSQTSAFDHQHSFVGNTNTIQSYHPQAFAGQLNAVSYPMHPSHMSSPFQDQVAVGSGYNTLQTTRHNQSGGPSPIHSGFPSPYYGGQQQQQPYMPYGGHYAHSNHMAYPPHYMHGPGSGLSPHAGELSVMPGRVMHGTHGPGAAIPPASPSQYARAGNTTANRATSNSNVASIPSTPRGPPRKPKQSGHALWVGNLPSGTIVGDLKDHFSRDATKDIESVFLISKSNCAFVNYRSEAACAAAMTRFHDSRFHGVRLVCRLRRNTTPSPTPGVPTGPAALMFPSSQNQTAFEAIAQNREVSSKASEQGAPDSSQTGEPHSKTIDKYFIMKSLTIEDMELSVRNSIWATQAHNEDALNKAYETTENVYLIFSANKSGEYFGFARMASPINEESAADLDWAPRGQVVSDDPDLPRSIPTPASEFAPKGRIIDDSARGTIFWEADLDEEEEILENERPDGVNSGEQDLRTDEVDGEGDTVTPGDVQIFGQPFKIEWLSTSRLPFYRTRGLRNPWNANRDVKIARDGTELETSVGRRLLQMFQRSPTDQLPLNYGPPGPF